MASQCSRNNFDIFGVALKNVYIFGRRVSFRPANPAICKVYFTKLTKFAFFLITIMFISQKCIIFASKFKNTTKIQQIFNIHK